MRERFFTPRSMERVVNHVEWEDDLVVYRDGTTNQQRYMMALAELWERWMREWSLPDFAQAVDSAQGGKFVEGLLEVISAVPQRIEQMIGFYRGLWYGANPRKLGISIPGRATIAVQTTVNQQAVIARLGWMMQYLRMVLEMERSENGE